MFVYHALHTCIKDCTYTIMGDVSQNIHSGYGLEDWEALRRLLLKDERAYFGLLKKSYRNTIEISEFATNILRHGDFPFYPVEPIVRHGKKPDLRRVAENTPEAFAAKTAAICRDWQKRGLPDHCGYLPQGRRCRESSNSFIQVSFHPGKQPGGSGFWKRGYGASHFLYKGTGI